MAGHWVYYWVHDPVTDQRVKARKWVEDPPKPAGAPGAYHPPKTSTAPGAASAAAAAAARRRAAASAASLAAEAKARAARDAQKKAHLAALAAARRAAYEALKRRQIAIARRAGLLSEQFKGAATEAKKPTLPGVTLAKGPAKNALDAIDPKQQHLAAEKARKQAEFAKQQAAHLAEITDAAKKKALLTTAKTGDPAAAAQIEKALAAEAANAAGTGKADNEFITKIQEKYEAHAQAIYDRYAQLVAQINAALEKGDIKTARRIYFGGAFKVTQAEFTRLFGNGTNPLKDGAYSKFYEDYKNIGIQQREWWKRQMQAALQSKLKDLQEQSKRFGEDTSAQQKLLLDQLGIFNETKLPNIQIGVDEHGRPIYRKATIEEALEKQRAQIIMEQERLAASRALAEKRRKAQLLIEGLVDYKGSLVPREDVPLLKDADRYVQTMLGGAVPSFKRDQDIQDFAEGLTKAWEKDHPAPKVTGPYSLQSPAALAWRRQRDAYRQKVYTFFGSKPPDFWESLFEAPGVSHGLAIFQSLISGLGAGSRVINASLFGESKVGGFSPDQTQFPIGFKTRLETAHKLYLKNNPGPRVEMGWNYQRAKMISAWLQTIEGKKWAEENVAGQRAESARQDLNFAGQFYSQTGDIGSKLQALNEYGSQPFQSGALNLLSSLLLDPTNAIPLKFTTYLARGKFALEAADTAGKFGKLKTLASVPQRFVTVDEGTLELRKFLRSAEKEFAKRGLSVEAAADMFREEVVGLKTASEFRTAFDKWMRTLGLDPRKISESQTFNFAEFLATKRAVDEEIPLLTQAKEFNARTVAQIKAAERAEKAAARKAKREQGKVDRGMTTRLEKGKAAQERLAIKRESLEDTLKEKSARASEAGAAPGVRVTHPKPAQNPDISGASDNLVAAKETQAVARKVRALPKSSRYSAADDYFKVDPLGNRLPREFVPDAEYRRLVTAAKGGDQDAFEQLVNRSRYERNRFRMEQEDLRRATGLRRRDVKFRPTSFDFVERAGVVGDEVAAARLIRDRKTIRMLKRVVGAKQKGDDFARAFTRRYRTKGDRHPMVEGDRSLAQSEIDDYGDLRGQVVSNRVAIGDDIVEARSSLRGVKDLYETFSHDALAHYDSAPKIYRALKDPKFVKNMTVEEFGKYVAFLDDMPIGAASFRDGGQWLFEVFHQLRLARDFDKLREFSDYMTAVLRDDELSIFGWMWKTMEERSVLHWSMHVNDIRSGFYHAAEAWNLHPELAFSTIPSGYYATRTPLSFGLAARLEGLADKASDLFHYAPKGYTKETAKNEVTRMFLGGSGEPTRIIHFVAERYGDFFKGGEVMVRIRDEMVHVMSLALGAEELTAIIGKHANAIHPDLLALAERRGVPVAEFIRRELEDTARKWGRAAGNPRPEFPGYRLAVERAYWAGDLPQLNGRAHTLMLLAHLQTNPDSIVGALRTYMTYMTKLGGSDLSYARRLVRELFDGEITTDFTRIVAEGSGRPGFRDAISGESQLVRDRSRIALWREFEFFPSDESTLAYAAKRRDNADELEQEFTQEAERASWLKEEAERPSPGGTSVDTSNFTANVESLVADVRAGKKGADKSLEATIRNFMERMIDDGRATFDQMALDAMRDAVEAMVKFPEAARAIRLVQEDLGFRRLDEILSASVEVREARRVRGVAARERRRLPDGGGPTRPVRQTGIPKNPSDFVEVQTSSVLGQFFLKGPFKHPAFHKGGGPSIFFQMDYGGFYKGPATKLHISAIEIQAQRTLEIVDSIARDMGVPYKWVKSKQELADWQDFGKGGIQQGKFITAYPSPDKLHEFTDRVARALHAEGIGKGAALAPSEVPYVTGPISHRFVPDASASGERFAPNGGYTAEHPDPFAAPPAVPPAETASRSIVEQMYDHIFKMTEDEWFAFEKARARRVLDSKTASRERKGEAVAHIRDIEAAEYAIKVEKSRGTYLPWRERARFQKKVLDAHGAEVEHLIAPKMIAPFALTAADAAVEQGRTYWRLLQTASATPVPSRVKGITINGKVVDHIPKKVWDDIEQRVSDAIAEARNFRADNRTRARRRGKNEESQRPLGKLSDNDPLVIKAKQKALLAYAKETGIVIPMDAYDEVRKVVWKGYVQNRTGKWLLARAQKIIAREGGDLETIFLRLREKEAKIEARRQLGGLAYREMYGHDIESIVAEFIRRYSDDGMLRHFTPELTPFQRATLEAHVKDLSGLDKLDERIGTFLQSANRPPFHSRELTRDFLTRIGAWSPRTAEDFVRGARSWSIWDEADYWRTAYGEVPEWTDPRLLATDFKPIFRDEQLYYQQMKAWGIFTRSQELKLRLDGKTAEEIERAALEGDPALGIKGRRELELQRKYVIERYGKLVSKDGHSLDEMPWLMYPDEYRRFLARVPAEDLPEGLVRNTGELDEIVALIETAMEPFWQKYVIGKTDGPVTYHDIFRVASEVQAQLLANPKWARRHRDIFGKTLDATAWFQRWLVFSNPSFLVTNLVDAPIKGMYYRMTRRGLFNPELARNPELAARVAALTPESIGLDATTAMYRIKQAGPLSRLRDPRGYTAMERAADRALALVDGTGQLFPTIAGRAELAMKMDLARRMYPTVYTESLKALKNPELADAASKAFIKKEVLRMWPTAGSGPIEQLWNRFVPFSTYSIRNKVLFISEAAANPWIVNDIQKIGAYIEKENLRQWEEDHPGTEMPQHLRRMIELPWAKGYFLDLSTFSDAARGLKPIFDFGKTKTVGEWISSWIRVVNPGTQALAYAFLNAFNVGNKQQWVAVLDANGYPTGSYTLVTTGWLEPWSDKQADFASAFWFGEAARSAAEFGFDGWTTGEISQMLGQVFFFNGIQTYDRGAVMASFYFNLRAKDPDAALQWLMNSDEGQLAQDWLTAKALEPREVFDRLRDMERTLKDDHRWFLTQTPETQEKIKSARSQIKAIRDMFAAELALLTPGTAEYREMKARMYLAINGIYLNTPELMLADVYGKTSAEWAVQLEDWATDRLMDDFMALNSQRPQRSAYDSAKAYNEAVAAWNASKQIFLQTYPQVASRLNEGRDALDILRTKVEKEWDATLTRIASRNEQIEAAKAIIAKAGRDSVAGAAAQDRLDILYLQNELDFSLLERDYAAVYFAPEDFNQLPFGVQGPPTLRGDIIKRVTVLLDFDRARYEKARREGRLDEFLAEQQYGQDMRAAIRYAKGGDPFGEFDGKRFFDYLQAHPGLRASYFGANPGKEAEWTKSAFYVEGIRSIVQRATINGKFDPATFVRLLKSNPALLAEYFKRHPGKKEQWARTDAYIKHISVWGKLASAGRWDEANAVWDRLPQWVKDEYRRKHPQKRDRAQQTSQYLGYMKTWVKFFDRGDKEGAMKYFNSLPAWAKERYYKAHPDKRAQFELDNKMAQKLRDYFAGDSASRADFLRRNPDLARWLASNASGKSGEIAAIMAAYRSIPKEEAWLRRVFRERYPEIFSQEAAGKRRLKRVFDTLAAHPEMLPEFEKWVKVIMETYMDMLKHGVARPLSSYFEYDRRVPRRKYFKSLSAEQASK